MASELTIEKTLEFAQPKAKAFAYLRDLKRRKEFMTIVDKTTITKKSGSDNLTGTRIKEVTHFLGFDMNLEYEVTGFEEGKLIALKCEDGPFYPFMEIKLDKGTAKTCQAHVTVAIQLGALKLMPMFILKPTVEAIVNGILKKLTEVVDNQ